MHNTIQLLCNPFTIFTWLLQGAIEVYSQALILRPDDVVLLSNRSAALLLAGLPLDAAEDAKRSIGVRQRRVLW